MRALVGWTVYGIILVIICVAIWRQTGEANRRQALLDEMRQREHDRYKPPRRFIPPDRSRNALP